MTPSPARSRILLLAAALLFSTGGAAIKAADLTSWQIACFRSGGAALVLFLCIPEARRGWTWRVWPAGIAYAATLVLFVLATRLTTSANAIFLQSTAPLYMLIIGPLLLKEPVSRADLAFIAVIAAGMSIFFLDSGRAAPTAPNPPLGNLLGAITGLTWALTLTGLRWQGRYLKQSGALATVVAGNIIGCLATLPVAVPVSHMSTAGVLVIGYLAVFQIGLAYWCVSIAVKHVPAFEATALLFVEPALNPVWSWLVHGERPGVLSIAGGAIILGSSILNTWWRSRRAA